MPQSLHEGAARPTTARCGTSARRCSPEDVLGCCPHLHVSSPEPVEFNIMRRNPVLARLSGGLSLAVLAAVLSFGSPSALRADEEVLTPALLELIVNPIVKTVEGLEQRLMHLEAAVGGWAESLMPRRLVVQQICLADDSGAQTCVTKRQLDALIGNAARAEIVEPAAPTTAQAESAAAAELITEPAAEAAGA